MPVERWVAYEHTPTCSDLPEFGEARFHQRMPDPSALVLRFHRNGAEPVPANGAITHPYWRERDMPKDATAVFGNERDGQRVSGSQGTDDELLRLMAVWMREKGSPS